MIFWFCFLIGTTLALVTPWITDKVWKDYWWWQLVAIPVFLGTICTVWISIGGIRDAIRLFKDLRAERIDESDDGFVKDAPAVLESDDGPSSVDKAKATEGNPA
jgi:hypothetical protein